jgi:murein L,D-transpeptidase YafK
MKKILIIILLPLVAFKGEEKPSFKDQQMEYYRVFEAYRDKWESANAKLRAAGINPYFCDIYIRGFKFEEDLEVWAKNKQDEKFSLISTYKFCNNVGELGPKRKEGDKQIPEGIYYLSRFNPQSDYFLSLKVSYPNRSDSLRGDGGKLGGEIYIHGGCQTIGCIPITDNGIKELYVFAVQAKQSGQTQIPIHIFPARLTNQNYELLKKQYSDLALHLFWKDLKNGYDLFEITKEIPRTLISPTGKYFFFGDE